MNLHARLLERQRRQRLEDLLARLVERAACAVEALIDGESPPEKVRRARRDLRQALRLVERAHDTVHEPAADAVRDVADDPDRQHES